MSDYYEEHAGERLFELWESVNDDFLKFDLIPEAERRHRRPDICAFIYLDEKFPRGGKDIISAAEHDEIFLDITSEQVESLSVEDVRYLTRCGVRLDADTDSLAMFV